ncbi:hypothetical protein YC2023_068731 [Brassica napus]
MKRALRLSAGADGENYLVWGTSVRPWLSDCLYQLSLSASPMESASPRPYISEYPSVMEKIYNRMQNPCSFGIRRARHVSHERNRSGETRLMPRRFIANIIRKSTIPTPLANMMYLVKPDYIIK